MNDTLIEQLRQAIEEWCQPSRERSLALTKLEECCLWLSKTKPVEIRIPDATAVRRAQGERPND